MSVSTMAGEAPKIHGKTEVEWAWEIHKNCDQLLHQRLAFFTAAQAMTLAAFMVLTNARFQLGIPPDRVHWIEAARYTLNLFGVTLSIFTWMVTKPMVMRLDYLNKTILTPSIAIYNGYLNDALASFTIPCWSWIDWGLMQAGVPAEERTPRKFYRNIIPSTLPKVELGFWLVLLGLLIGADLVTRSAPAVSAVPPNLPAATGCAPASPAPPSSAAAPG